MTIQQYEPDTQLTFATTNIIWQQFTESCCWQFSGHNMYVLCTNNRLRRQQKNMKQMQMYKYTNQQIFKNLSLQDTLEE